jgi:hypothetical protein
MRAAALAVLLLTPAAASACSVCFGGVDGRKAFFMGLGWSILIMLAFTLTLIGGIAWTLWTIERGRKDA